VNVVIENLSTIWCRYMVWFDPY